MHDVKAQLQSLLRRFGNVGQDLWPWIESVGVNMSLGEAETMVPLPRGPSCLIGASNNVGGLGTVRLFVNAKGGAFVSGVLTPLAGAVEPIDLSKTTFAAAQAAPLANSVSLQVVNTSDPTSDDPTTVGELGDSPVAANRATFPNIAHNAFASQVQIPRMYVGPGEVWEMHGTTNSSLWGLALEVREFPQAFFKP